MTTKKRNLIMGIGAVLVVLAALVPELHHQPLTLLQRTRKVTRVKDWDAKHDNYFWISNSEVLLVTQANGPAYGGVLPVLVRRVNAVTGSVTVDKALTARLQRSTQLDTSDWQLSPDSRWLLCHNDSRRWVAASLDGAHLMTWPLQGDGSGESGILTAWLPDGRSWIQAVEDQQTTHTYLYQLNKSTVTDHSGNFGLDGLEVVGFYGPTRLLTILPQTGDGGGVSMADYDILNPAASSHFYFQYVPPNMDIQQVRLSPDRSRLAWKFTVKPLPLGLRATINSNYVRRSSPVTAGLWTSDLNCNNLHEVGTVDIRDDQITNLRWTPDGKRLSFIDGDTLYTIPAD